MNQTSMNVEARESGRPGARWITGRASVWLLPGEPGGPSRTASLLLAGIFALAVALVGCHLAPGGMARLGGPPGQMGATSASPVLSGRVDWSAGGAGLQALASGKSRIQALSAGKASSPAETLEGTRRAQATAGDLVASTTVSLINTGSNTTVATGLTNASGAFSLTLAGYTPTTGETDILEAVKGLDNQAPGASAARMRTLLEWNGSAWLSITNATAGGNIVIDTLTTAVTIESELDPTDIPAASTMGKVNVGVTPAVLVDPPGPYTNHPDAEIDDLSNELATDLGANADPVASIPTVLPSISSFTPNSAIPDGLVQITGSGFSPALGGNTATIGGAAAQVLLATPTELVVVVPPGAVSGSIGITTGRGSTSVGGFTMLPTAPTLAISSFSPTSGRAGTVVTLTGGFGNPATGATPSVFFAPPSTWTGPPPQATVTARTAGSLTVTVPIGAVPGPISLSSGGSSAQSATSFNVWQGDISSIVNLTQASASLPAETSYTLPEEMNSSGYVQYNNVLYMLGGYGGLGTSLQDVYGVPLDADGSLGTIFHAGTMQDNRDSLGAAAYNGWLYAVGGRSTYQNNNPWATIEQAPINADGSLGPFSYSAAQLQTARCCYPTTAQYQNHIYVIGGSAGNAATTFYPLSSIERFDIGAGGALSWVATYSLNVGGSPVTSMQGPLQAPVVGNYIFLSEAHLTGDGVSNCSTCSLSIPINPDGSIGAATFGPQVPTQAAAWGNEIAIGNTLYDIGGYDDLSSPMSELGSVFDTTVNPTTGTIGSWNYISSMVQSECSPSAVAVQANQMYVFGGQSGSSSSGFFNTADIQTTTVNANGNLDWWSFLGGMQHYTYGQVVDVFKNKLWSIGGELPVGASPQSSTWSEYHEIQPDGSLGPAAMGPQLAYSVMMPESAVAYGPNFPNGYLYVMSGCGTWSNGVCANNNNPEPVQRATINSDGTLGPFLSLPVSLNIQRQGGSAVVLGNYLYVFGGAAAIGHPGGGQAQVASIERATIETDGSLSPFVILDQELPDGGLDFGIPVVTGPYLYLIGGTTPTQVGPDFRAQVFPDGTIGQFAPEESMATPVVMTSVARFGNSVYAFGGDSGTCCTAGAMSNVIQQSIVNPDGTLGPWKNLSITLPNPWRAPSYTPGIYQNWFYFLGGADDTAASCCNPYQQILQGTIH